MTDYDTLVAEFVRLGRRAREAQLAVEDESKAGPPIDGEDSYTRRSREKRETEQAALPLPSGGRDFLKQLAKGRQRAVAISIAFLQADPFFATSGYMKVELIRRLKRVPLTDLQKQRLRAVALARVDGPDRNEFAAYGKLALAVRSPGLEAEVQRRLSSDDPGIRRRARWMMLRFASVPARKCDA